jgi:hypothetical protein
MLLKTQSAFGKRTQNEPKNDARFEHPTPELKPNSEVARLKEKKPLTWLATLATLSPRKRAAHAAWSGIQTTRENIKIEETKREYL